MTPLRKRRGRFPRIPKGQVNAKLNGFHAPQRDRPVKVQHPKPVKR